MNIYTEVLVDYRLTNYVIYGLLLLDGMGFSLMEVFTDEFFKLKITKNDVVKVLSTFSMKNIYYDIGDYKLEFTHVDKSHAIGICVYRDFSIPNSLKRNL